MGLTVAIFAADSYYFFVQFFAFCAPMSDICFVTYFTKQFSQRSLSNSFEFHGVTYSGKIIYDIYKERER